MPLYDCGDPDCSECELAFGPDRSAAIERHLRREASYATPAIAHTPGPWQVSGIRMKLGQYDCQRVGPDDFPLAFIPIGATHEELTGAMADARLIAAAPDLLAALIQLRDELGAMADTMSLGSPLRNDMEDWCHLARAAIAKAEGR